MYTIYYINKCIYIYIYIHMYGGPHRTVPAGCARRRPSTNANHTRASTHTTTRACSSMLGANEMTWCDAEADPRHTPLGHTLKANYKTRHKPNATEINPPGGLYPPLGRSCLAAVTAWLLNIQSSIGTACCRAESAVGDVFVQDFCIDALR